MSQETMEWLNTMTLIGFTTKRGSDAWHYRKHLQPRVCWACGERYQATPDGLPKEKHWDCWNCGSRVANHYSDAIPVDDVLRRLFNFEVVEQPIYVPNMAVEYEGEDLPRFIQVPNRKAMVASDNGDVLGIFKDGYQGHDYKKWLLENVATLLSDDLGIGSAGLLRNRGQAWVSVEVPDSITTPEGVEFRPHLTACTSFDGSLATTYKRHVQLVVCDNTLASAIGEKGQVYKVKHSKYSNMKIQDARTALGVVFEIAAEFEQEVKRLTQIEVSNKAFEKLLDLVMPLPEKPGRSMTRVSNRRDQIVHLYRADARSADWNGTAFGVLQAFNTYNHHHSLVHKVNGQEVPRVIRNMERVLADDYARADSEIMDKLDLAVAMVA